MKQQTCSRKINVAGIMMVVVLSVAQANAQSVVQPIAGDESTSIAGFGRTVTTTINSDGLDSTPSTSTGDPVPTTWPGHTNDAGNDGSPHNIDATMWLSASATVADQWVMYDLGDSYELEGMHVWNYNEVNITTRGIKDVEVKFSTSLTGAFGSTDETDTGWSPAINDVTSFTQAPGITGYTGEDYSFSQVTARYVLFDVQTSHGDPDYVGLSEVRFITAPPPPAGTVFIIK